jgi:hypothetical protein
MNPTEASYLVFSQSVAIPDYFQEFLTFFIQENSKILVRGHMENPIDQSHTATVSEAFFFRKIYRTP